MPFYDLMVLIPGGGKRANIGSNQRQQTNQDALNWWPGKQVNPIMPEPSKKEGEKKSRKSFKLAWCRLYFKKLVWKITNKEIKAAAAKKKSEREGKQNEV